MEERAPEIKELELADQLALTVSMIHADARVAAESYLKDSIVPEGGE